MGARCGVGGEYGEYQWMERRTNVWVLDVVLGASMESIVDGETN